MPTTVKTPPTFEPVTLGEAKESMNVSHGLRDSLITDLIVAARIFVEARLRQTLPTKTLTLHMDAWPTARRYGVTAADADAILLPMPPASAVATIKYIDTDGDTQTWAAAKYRKDFVSWPARITRAYGESYPSARAVTSAIEVEYTAGRAAADIPAQLKAAVRMLTQHLLDHPQVATERALAMVPMGTLAMIDSAGHGQLAGAVAG